MTPGRTPRDRSAAQPKPCPWSPGSVLRRDRVDGSGSSVLGPRSRLHRPLRAAFQFGLDFLVGARSVRARNDHRQQAAQPAAAGGISSSARFIPNGLVASSKFLLAERHALRGRGTSCAGTGARVRANRGRDRAFLRYPREDRRRFGHPKCANSPQAIAPSSGSITATPAWRNQSALALGRRMLPHAHVHRRHGQHRLVGRQDQRGRQVVGDPGGHLGQLRSASRAHTTTRSASRLSWICPISTSSLRSNSEV